MKTTAEPNELAPTCDDQWEVRQLLREIANGSRPAFQEFHQRFSQMVFATVIQVPHHQEDAEDAVQEIFATVWKKADCFCSEKGKPSTWLATLARNRAIDKLRSRQRRGKLNDAFQEDSLARPASGAVDPSEHAAIAELHAETRSAVLQLSPEQRMAIQLAFFQGLTQQEVAERTGQALGTVKARIRRGLGKLREIVGVSMRNERALS